ncbi:MULTISPECIES: aldehyde dehydrogenase family protein [unclassified Crossiella]|uniref:aldehyde dehydrogenase family protein n=1 Tax=unclassified Crossiella TaxID=2620835 RepID=UPI001FFF6039|nr:MULTISPECIES: aldehyde dehydrogenase family protein [unclassified Crossiella]MCK2244631.1 aldehyde dehydrogenase family protein [Crossiella sp. S99.2]MCK2258382.1 aldehyde dehydrogenase family protein [Crossiella sp. S99.1]
MSDLPTGQQLLGGRLVSSSRVTTSISPADGSVLGSYADADQAQAREAVAVARAAFQETTWSRDRRLRHRVLTDIADAIERRTDEFVRLLARENGKILGEAGFELSLTAPKLRYYAALALSEGGRAAEVAPGLHIRTVPEPIGVAGVIVPWNSPVVLSVRSFAPALAAGCTVVMKLPGRTGLVNGLLHQVLADIDSLPAGVLNSLTESGDAVARFLVSSPEVDALSYTGSTTVGRAIMAGAAGTLKRLSLELGGKTPMIVFDDADLDAVVPVLTKAVTTFSGQFCMTGSRVLAQRGIADELRARLSSSLEAVKVGPGDDETSEMGPMTDTASARRVDDLVAAAAGHATVLVRGGLPQDAGHSAYFRPSLIEVADTDSPLVQQEIFGPVATFEVFDTEAEAVRRANATEYGLAASVWSRDVDRPLRVGRELRAGTVWTNSWAIVADQFEEGGFGQSGLGRLNGLRGLSQFQEDKTYVQQLG